MPKIQLMLDSACDIDRKLAQKRGIRILPCHVTTAEGSYLDGVDFTSEDVYRYVDEHGVLPQTSQVTAIEWMEAYREAAESGIEDIIVITMNASGSGTNAAAKQAFELLRDDDEELCKNLTVRVIDSTGYSIPTELGVRRVLPLIERGASAREAAKYLEDWYSKQVILLGLGSLDYAKKSGRLNTVAAFVGEVLGLKPIMSLHTSNRVISKARGEAALIDRLAKMYVEYAAEQGNGEYVIAYGRDKEKAKRLIAAVKKLGGKEPVAARPCGTCIAINAGPEMVGIGFIGNTVP